MKILSVVFLSILFVVMEPYDPLLGQREKSNQLFSCGLLDGQISSILMIGIDNGRLLIITKNFLIFNISTDFLITDQLDDSHLEIIDREPKLLEMKFQTLVNNERFRINWKTDRIFAAFLIHQCSTTTIVFIIDDPIYHSIAYDLRNQNVFIDKFLMDNHRFHFVVSNPMTEMFQSDRFELFLIRKNWTNSIAVAVFAQNCFDIEQRVLLTKETIFYPLCYANFLMVEIKLFRLDSKQYRCPLNLSVILDVNKGFIAKNWIYLLSDSEIFYFEKDVLLSGAKRELFRKNLADFFICNIQQLIRDQSRIEYDYGYEHIETQKTFPMLTTENDRVRTIQFNNQSNFDTETNQNISQRLKFLWIAFIFLALILNILLVYLVFSIPTIYRLLRNRQLLKSTFDKCYWINLCQRIPKSSTITKFLSRQLWLTNFKLISSTSDPKSKRWPRKLRNSLSASSTATVQESQVLSMTTE